MFSTLDHHPLLSEPLEWRTGELEGSGDLKGQDEKYIVGVGVACLKMVCSLSSGPFGLRAWVTGPSPS